MASGTGSRNAGECRSPPGSRRWRSNQRPMPGIACWSVRHSRRGQVGRTHRDPGYRRREARSGLRRQDPAHDRGSRDDVTERGYGKTARRPGHLGSRGHRHGAGGVRKVLCFTGPRGGYLKRSTFRRVYWLPAIEEAGVPGMRVHDMRHSAISWWVAAHIPLADVRDRAGHSSIAVTNTYVHTMPPDDDPFLAILGEAA